MKKLFIVLIISAIPLLSFAQVFNTATTLKPGHFSIGLNPAVYENEFGLFLHGGVGIVPKVDFALHYGIMEYKDYFGADLEWKLLSAVPNISLTTGAHHYYDPGLDLAFNMSFPIVAPVTLYTGIDSDINFDDDHDAYIPLWWPIGVDISIKNKMSFLFEAEIPLSHHAQTIISGGLAFYF